MPLAAPRSAPRKSIASAISSDAARPGAFGQHRRRQARDAVLAARIVGASGHDDQIHLHDRHFVQLDDPDRQAIRELALLDLRQLQRRRRPERRRLGPVGACAGQSPTAARTNGQRSVRSSSRRLEGHAATLRVFCFRGFGFWDDGQFDAATGGQKRVRGGADV